MEAAAILASLFAVVPSIMDEWSSEIDMDDVFVWIYEGFLSVVV